MADGKILGSWSGMRKYLEKDMLAPSLQGRVRYGCTRFVGMDGCHIFEICVDGQPVKRFSWETVNSYFIHQGYAPKEKPGSIPDYWEGFWTLLGRYPLSERTEYTDKEFCDALTAYRGQDIQSSLFSSHPIVSMFALLDRRVGRGLLSKYAEGLSARPTWLRSFYELRIRAEESRKDEAACAL